MKSLRLTAGTIACYLVLGLCAIVAGVQVMGLARRVVTWQRRQPPVPAFGQADIVYFSEPTCPACQIATPTILTLQRRVPPRPIAPVDTSPPARIAPHGEGKPPHPVAPDT